MKKVLAVMLISLIALIGFVSCTNETNDLNATKSLVLAVPGSNNARALNRAPESLDEASLYWMYEATKADDSGLVTGQTTGRKNVQYSSKTKGLDHEVGPFSQGLWNFKLYGFKDQERKHLAWTGSYDGYRLVVGLDEGDVTPKVIIDVHRLKTSKTQGVIRVPENVTLKDKKGNVLDPSKYTQIVKIAPHATPEVYLETVGVKNDTFIDYTVDSGSYIVTVSAETTPDVPDTNIVYAVNSISVNVYDNITTTVGGELDERRFNTSFGTNENGDTIAQSEAVPVAPEGNTELFVQSNIVEPQSTSATATKITLPQGALDSTAKQASVNIIPYDSSKANIDGFVVTKDEAVVGAIDINLKVDDKLVSTFNGQEVIVTTTIASNLTSAPETADTPENVRQVKVAYPGTPEEQPRTLSYDPTTGQVVFATKHFSKFYVTLNPSTGVIYNVTKSKVYDDFAEAMAVSDSDDTLIMLNDAVLDEHVVIPATKVVLLEGNGHSLTITPNDSPAKTTEEELWLFEKFTGTIRNLNYHTTKCKMLIENGAGVIFEDCAAYGDMDPNINIAPFVCYSPSDVSFYRCKNYVNIVDEEGGESRGAAFIGYYPGSMFSDFVFEDCENYGHLKFATDAAMFFGNASKEPDPEDYVIRNCANYGVIEAYDANAKVGVLNWNHPENIDEINKSKDGMTGEIKVIKPTIEAFSVAADGTPSFQIANTEKYNATYKIKYYTTYIGNGAYGNKPGLTQTATVDLKDGKLPNGFIMSDDVTLDQTVNAENKFVISPYAQNFYLEKDYPEAKVANLEYIVILKDKITGNIVGQRYCLISK